MSGWVFGFKLSQALNRPGTEYCTSSKWTLTAFLLENYKTEVGRQKIHLTVGRPTYNMSVFCKMEQEGNTQTCIVVNHQIVP